MKITKYAIQEVNKYRRQGNISYEQKLILNEIHREIFGEGYHGFNPTCSTCIRDMFAKIEREIEKHVNQPGFEPSV